MVCGSFLCRFCLLLVVFVVLVLWVNCWMGCDVDLGWGIGLSVGLNAEALVGVLWVDILNGFGCCG